MAERDRIERLEYDLARVSRQIAGMPVRIAQSSGGSEKARALRGTYYSGTTTLSVKNIVILDSGTDPRTDPEDADAIVEVANVPADTYTGSQPVYADWSEENEQWEARPKSSGSESLRLLRAKAKGAVAPQATSFTVDNIIVEAGGIDPRSTPGDMAEELTVFKLQKEAFVDNEDVTLIYSPEVSTGIDWELVVVERNRALRGTVYSGTTTLLVDHIVVLDSGRDPRSDPTSTTETVSVTVINGDSFANEDDVWADWSVANNRWEARPKASSAGTGFYTALITNQISAGSASVPIPGSAQIFEVNEDGSTTSLGSQTIYNPYGIRALGSCAAGKLREGSYLILGPPLTECTMNPVTNVDCDEVDGLTFDTTEYSYAAVTCAPEAPPVAEAKIVSNSITASTNRRHHGIISNR